jgi:alanine racemase
VLFRSPNNYQVRKRLPYYFGVSDLLSLDSLGKYQKHAIVHLELDTGMSRLGFTSVDLPHVLTLLNKYPHLRVEGLYSHFAVADNPAQLTYTKSQVDTFKSLATFLDQHGVNVRYRHIAATAGAELQSDPYFNLIRPGLGFYGYTPYGPRTTEGLRQRKYLIPALTLTSHLAHLTTLQPGQGVGYGLTYRAKQTECLATLPLGYHEGVSRGLSNLGVVNHGSTLCPIIGRVSMNMTMIKIPRTLNLSLNDPVTVINPDPQAKNSVYAIAKSLDTIPYTVLTQLHSSIRRRVTV